MSQKTICITGASSGIGEALAIHYAKEKHHLILNGTNKERLIDVSKKCEDLGASISSKIINVCDQQEMASWLLKEDQKTPIDIVIANAGISSGTSDIKENELMPQIRKIYDVNITGVLNTIEPIVTNMIKRKSGQVALMSSMAAYAPWPGAPAYASSKTTMLYLGHSLRGTLKPYNIKVSVISPGFVKSRITDKNKFPMPFFKKADYAAQKIAVGLENNRTTIAFPLPTYVFSLILGALPHSLSILLNSKMPKKSGR